MQKTKQVILSRHFWQTLLAQFDCFIAEFHKKEIIAASEKNRWSVLILLQVRRVQGSRSFDDCDRNFFCNFFLWEYIHTTLFVPKFSFHLLRSSYLLGRSDKSCSNGQLCAWNAPNPNRLYLRLRGFWDNLGVSNLDTLLCSRVLRNIQIWYSKIV